MPARETVSLYGLVLSDKKRVSYGRVDPVLARQLQDSFGVGLSTFERIRLPVELRQLLDRNEDYWERGDGSRPPRTDVRYPNLGIYGWALSRYSGCWVGFKCLTDTVDSAVQARIDIGELQWVRVVGAVVVIHHAHKGNGGRVFARDTLYVIVDLVVEQPR